MAAAMKLAYSAANNSGMQNLANMGLNAAKEGAAVVADAAATMKRKMLHEYGDYVLSETSNVAGASPCNWKNDPQRLEDIIRGADLANGIYTLKPRTNEELNSSSDIAGKALARALNFEELNSYATALKSGVNVALAVATSGGGGVDKDERKKIDSYALYEFSTGTLWIIFRGTVTVADFLTDVDWANTTDVMQLKFPASSNKRAKDSLVEAYDFCEKVLTPKNHIVQRIAFAGHSLGGALAINAYMLHLSGAAGGKDLGLPTQVSNVFVVTLGAPLIFNHESAANFKHSLKGSGLKMDDHLPELEHWAENVFNLVCRLDVIPSSVGPQQLPSALMDNEFIGKYIRHFLNTLGINRDSFVPFGNYYSVNPTFDEDHNQNAGVASVLSLSDPLQLFNIWPTQVLHWPLSLEDHNSDVYLEAVRSLRPGWTPPIRAMNVKAADSSKTSTGLAMSMGAAAAGFAVMSAAAGGMSPAVGVAPMDRHIGGAESSSTDNSGALTPVFGCCCSIASCVLRWPECCGITDTSICCCFEIDEKCCVITNRKDACLNCWSQSCMCIMPTTCLKCACRCFCLDSRWAFPCDKDVPCLVNCLGFSCMFNGNPCLCLQCPCCWSIDAIRGKKAQSVAANK